MRRAHGETMIASPSGGDRSIVWLRWSLSRGPLAYAVLTAAICALAWLSLAILGSTRIAPIWPANGVLLAVLLRNAPRVWPAALAAGFIGIGAGGMLNGGAAHSSFALALCDLVEVGLSAFAIKAIIRGPPDLSRMRFVAVGGAVALVSAAVGAVGAGVVLDWLGRGQILTSALIWTLANGLGQMTAAPIVLASRLLEDGPEIPQRNLAWGGAGLVALIIVVVVTFQQNRYDMVYLILGPLLLVVFQLEVLGAAIGILLTAVLAVAFTVQGHGPMWMLGNSPSERVLLLQFFLLAVAAVIFPLAAALADRRRTQAGARLGEARLAFLSEHSRDIVMRIGPNRSIIDVSPSIRRYGYEPEDLIGLYSGVHSHADDLPAISTLLDSLAADRQTSQSEMKEWRVQPGNGGWVWMEGSVTCIRDAQEDVSEFVLVMRDISERRAAAEAIAYSEARYRLLAENSQDIVFEFDDKSRILYASAAIRLLGYTPADVVGRSCFSIVHPDDVAAAQRAMAAAFNPSPGDELVSREWRLRAKTGDYIWFEGNPSVSRDAAGRPAGFTDSVRDISRRKVLEEELRDKQAEADASEQARRAAEARARENQDELARVSRVLSVGEFASTIAHELNQPIAAIVTNGDTALRWLAADPPVLDEARAAVARSIRDANRAAAVVSRTRAMLAKGSPAFAEVDINACINDVLLFTDTALRRNRITVIRRLATALPKVWGDRIQLQQVLLNLIGNGMDAMVANEERPRMLAITTGVDDVGDVLVAVEDSGAGLDPAVTGRLFDSFFTTKADGVGLGLPISRSIVETHGGRLSAANCQEGGAVFRFTLRPAKATAA